MTRGYRGDPMSDLVERAEERLSVLRLLAEVKRQDDALDIADDENTHLNMVLGEQRDAISRLRAEVARRTAVLHQVYGFVEPALDWSGFSEQTKRSKLLDILGVDSW